MVGYFFTFSDVYMLGHGCDVSHYTQLYDRYLDKYQLLTRPYLEFFEGYTGKNHKTKMGVRLGRSSRNVCKGMY